MGCTAFPVPILYPVLAQPVLTGCRGLMQHFHRIHQSTGNGIIHRVFTGLSCSSPTSHDKALTVMVHIDSPAHDCYIQREASVPDSHAGAPPSHLAYPSACRPHFELQGEPQGAESAITAPLYCSLTKRCSGPRSKQYGVRMFRDESVVDCSILTGQRRSQGRYFPNLPDDSANCPHTQNSSAVQMKIESLRAGIFKMNMPSKLSMKKGNGIPKL